MTLLFDAGSSAHKRNLAVSHVKGKYVLFLDDDIELHPAYLSEATALLDDFPAIVGFSGKLLKDGNITRAEAKELIHRWHDQEHWRGRLSVENRSTQFLVLTSSSAEAFSRERASTSGYPNIPLERIMIFGCALNAMASPADTIVASLFISEHQADG